MQEGKGPGDDANLPSHILFLDISRTGDLAESFNVPTEDLNLVDVGNPRVTRVRFVASGHASSEALPAVFAPGEPRRDLIIT